MRCCATSTVDNKEGSVSDEFAHLDQSIVCRTNIVAIVSGFSQRFQIVVAAAATKSRCSIFENTAGPIVSFAQSSKSAGAYSGARPAL